MERKIIGDSKITPPKLSNILYRGRLIEMLEQNRERKIILILGQPAEGKSTLAASYLKECKKPSAWINLTGEESDPVNFFLLMTYSLHSFLEKDVFSNLINYLSMDFGPRAEKPLFQRWIKFLIEGLSCPVQIIIDGLDRLSQEAPAFHLLQVFLEETNFMIHFILLSRKEPAFEIQRLKMSGEAAVIDNKHLAFTFEEAKSFFTKMHHTCLPLNNIKCIHKLTEGWVGGLLLFSEAIKETSGEFQEKFFSKEPIREFKREAFRYLGEEIFSSLDKSVREFLVKSSIFEWIAPGFIKEFLKLDNSEAILKELSERNLFIQELYDEKHGWLFRYHQLFKEFLRARLESQITGKERRCLYNEAAQAFVKAEEYEYALDYYLEAKNSEGASKVLELIGMTFLRQGRIGDLSMRLRQIPADLIQNNPWLLFYLSMTRRFIGMRENTQSLSKCLGIFEKYGDIRGQILSLAFLIEAFLYRGYFTVSIEDLIARAETLLESAPQNPYEYESAILWFQVAHASTICCGNSRKGIWCCQKAHLIAAHYGDINLQVSAMSREAEAYAWLGEFDSADKVISKVHQLVKASPISELQVYYMVAVGRLLVLRGEMEQAREEILRARELVENHGLLFWHLPTLAVDIPVCIYKGELEKAENAVGSLQYMALSLGNQVFEGIAMFFKSLICDRKGDLHKAKELAGDSARLLSSKESLTLWQHYAAIILRSLILYRLDEEGIENELEKTIDDLSNLGCYLLLVDAHLVMAISKRKKAQIKETASNLKEGFRIAKEKKHFHTLILKREDLADACVLVLELNVTEAVDYVSYLLSTHLWDLADFRLKRLEAHPDANAQIRVYAKELRKVIYRLRLSPLRIQCLGRFQLFRGNQLIQEEEWQRTQPKNLLKALISRGAEQISREVLMEDLWPESKFQASEKNFKITLHRLRKTLEPDMKQSYGSSYLHLRENRLSLNKELCSVDVDDFIDLIKKGQNQEDSENLKKAVFFYNKALDLYKGDFMEEELYFSWAKDQREKLRRIHVETLLKMAAIFEKQGKAKAAIGCYQKIIQIEPLMEKAYQKMMLLYEKRRMRNAALKTYEECRKVLINELESEPDELTVAIYRKIAEKE